MFFFRAKREEICWGPRRQKSEILLARGVRQRGGGVRGPFVLILLYLDFPGTGFKP